MYGTTKGTLYVYIPDTDRCGMGAGNRYHGNKGPQSPLLSGSRGLPSGLKLFNTFLFVRFSKVSYRFLLVCRRP